MSKRFGATSAANGYLEYVLDQLKPFATVRSRRMFGGFGLYADDLFFGLIGNDVLYFKVDDSNRADYVSRGCEPFRPVADDPQAVSLNYFRVPEEVLEDPDELRLWARKSLAVAVSAAAVKASRAARKKSARKLPRSSKSRT